MDTSKAIRILKNGGIVGLRTPGHSGIAVLPFANNEVEMLLKHQLPLSEQGTLWVAETALLDQYFEQVHPVATDALELSTSPLRVRLSLARNLHKALPSGPERWLWVRYWGQGAIHKWLFNLGRALFVLPVPEKHPVWAHVDYVLPLNEKGVFAPDKLRQMQLAPDGSVVVL